MTSDRIAKEDYVDTAVATKASATLTSAHVLVGNVSNVATDVAVSGDVTITNAGVTAIGASKVTNAMIAAVDGAKITTGTVPIARLPTGTGSSNVPLGGVITGAGPTGDASHTLALTYNAAGQLTAVTNNAIAIAESAVTGLVADLALKAPLASPALTGTPTAPTQTAGDASTAIATDAFVTTAINNAISGLDVKPDVAYVSLAALPANTYANGTAGVGATLTGNANGPLVIDGVTLVVGQAGERVLVAAESASANNGWYTITQVGVVAVSPYILTRATESDQAAEIGAGYLTGVVAPNTVVAGTNNGKLYISVAADPFTVGTTALTFSQVGGTYGAGNGVTLTGSTFSIDTAITVDKTTAQTLTNKTLTSPAITTPTGIVKGDVGLGNVDNTSNATERAATATLTNKKLSDTTTTVVNASDATKVTKFDLSGATAAKTATLALPVTLDRTITFPDATDTLVGKATTDTLTNKSIDASQLTGTIAIARIPTGTTSSTVPLGGVITAAGPQGDATHTQVLTWNAAGQVTTVTNTAIALAATGDVTGTLPGATTLVGTANVESIIRANSLDQFAAAAANVNLNSNRIINVTDPSSAQDAMTLQYANTTYAPKASPTFTGTVTAPIVNASGLVTASADLAVSGATSSSTALITYGAAATYTASQTAGDTSVANRFATTASMQHFGCRIRDTDTWAVAPSIVGAFIGIDVEPTIVNDSATSFDYTLAYSAFNAQVTIKVDTQTGRNLGTMTDYGAGPNFLRANSGTFTAGVHRGFSATPIMNATGCTLTSTTDFQSGLTVTAGTVTTRTGLLISEATGAGTLTNQYGIDIVALSKGGTVNVGIRNASSTQLGSSQQCTIDTSGNISTSGTLSVTGHATLEGVTSTGATGTGKLVFDGTPTLVTPNIGAATGTSLNLSTGALTAGTTTLGATTLQLSGVAVKTANYTLLAGDAHGIVTMNNASARTITIPANSSVAYATGTVVYFYNLGAGTLTIAITTDTLTGTTTYAQNKGGFLVKTAATTWLAFPTA